MNYFRICPYCGAHLDSGENCDCVSSMYAALTPENRTKIDAFVHDLVIKQKTARGADNTTGGKVEHVDHAVSTSNNT